MTAADTTPAPSRPSRAVVGGRGKPQLVTVRKTTFLSGLLEGIALALDAEEAADRIQTAAATGNRSLVVNEAGRLGVRAGKARVEFRRLVAEAER